MLVVCDWLTRASTTGNIIPVARRTSSVAAVVQVKVAHFTTSALSERVLSCASKTTDGTASTEPVAISIQIRESSVNAVVDTLRGIQ